MKDIRIFIASSSELLQERNYLAFLVLANEVEFARRGFRVRLAKWEYVDPKMTADRTEDRYLNEMYASDAALILFRDVAGMFTCEEMDKAIEAERSGNCRLKAHRILFCADGKPGSEAVKLRAELSYGSYGIWSDREELRKEFLALVEKVAQREMLVDMPSGTYVRKITAFLAADAELVEERNAFADTVLNVNDLLEQAHYNICVQLRFYDSIHAEEIIESSEIGLVLYGTSYRVFGKKEIDGIYARVKDDGQNPKRFYVFFRDLDDVTEKSLDEAFRTFRDNFVSRLEHFSCQFGDANALRLCFLLSLMRYTGESIRENYSTVPAPTTPVFAGREKELLSLCGLLEPIPGKFPAGRLPVITGAGGIGKSELARQYALQLRVQYPGGVFQVNMESIMTWDETFLGILGGVSNNGVAVSNYLGLKDSKYDSCREGNRKITGSEVRDALLKRAREYGPILLVLDNVEHCELFSGRDGGFSRAFPSGFSERVRINVVATARVCDVKLSPTDWAVCFHLDDLPAEAALKILLADHPAADAAERKAANHVAELLGNRALYLQHVPALIGDFHAETRCDSYAELAKALEDNLLGTVAEETQNSYLPNTLWKMSQEHLLRMPLGPECVKLVQVASFFSSSGCPQHILKHLWQTIIDPNHDTRTFARAFEIIRRHNIFQSAEPIRIHRLDRLAIQNSIIDGRLSLEEEIGGSLAGYLGMSPDDWLLLSDNGRVLSHIPICTLNVHCGGKGLAWIIICERSYLWTELLIANNSLQYHPWEQLDGSDWTLLLSQRPDFAEMCDWGKLDERDWADLLSAQPQLADKCDWGKLYGGGWASLLSAQPQLADKCDWGKLSGGGWASLLSAQPQFADKCDWGKLSGEDWACLLSARPQFAGRCTWEVLTGSDWADLLGCQFERFAPRCEWDKLTGADWMKLLAKQPQLSSRFHWPEKFDFGGLFNQINMRGSWFKLLCAQPQFADKCPWEMLNFRDSGWVELISAQPQFYDKCPEWTLDGGDWGRVLKCQPQLFEKCPLDKLTGSDWACLLEAQPQLFEKCPLEKLTGHDWVSLLEAQPQFSEKCQWDKLNGHHWASLLIARPQFFEKCHWEELDASDWTLLVIVRPQFLAVCRFEKFKGADWVALLKKRPELGDKCAWDRLTGSDWAELLVQHPCYSKECAWEKLGGRDWVWLLEFRPEFSDKCPWDKVLAEKLLQPGSISVFDLKDTPRPNLGEEDYSGKDWADWIQLLCNQPDFALKQSWPWGDVSRNNWLRLLGAQPRFADRCPWNVFDGKAWSILLQVHPMFNDRCPWEKLTGSDWADLLRSQPDFHGYCNWELLDGSDWVRLLSRQPQFADKCRWGKIGFDCWYDWIELLRKRPEFADKCPWERMNGDNWCSLLQEQPGFAEKCNWDLLDGGNWAWLLQDQPQFKDKCQWNKLSAADWATLLCKQPQFKDKCQLDKFSGADWATLLCEQPYLADQCPWADLSGSDWARLLPKQFHFSKYCSWEKLDGADWTNLLFDMSFHGESDFCFYNIENKAFNDDNLAHLIIVCPWQKLDGRNWSHLLPRLPELADKCPWEKLSGVDWAWLLSEAPQYADKCQWEKLDGFDLAWLLKNVPEFGSHCDFGKLNSSNWSLLLSSQPQFEDFCPATVLLDMAFWKLIGFHKECTWKMLCGWIWKKLRNRQQRSGGMH